jgi:LPXTG-motif cell wall-anchored protein
MDMSKFSDRVRQMLKDNHRWNVQRGWVAAGALVLVVAVCAMLTGHATALVGQDALKNTLTDDTQLYRESANAGESGWMAVDEDTPVAGDAALRLRLAFKLSSNQLDDSKTLSYKLPESLTLPDSKDGETIAVFDGANAGTADETGDAQIGSATIKDNVLTLTLDAAGQESGSGTESASGEAADSAADSSSQAAEISGFVDLDFTFDEVKLDDDGSAALRLSSSRVLHVTRAATETDLVSLDADASAAGNEAATASEEGVAAAEETAAKAAPAALLASSDSSSAAAGKDFGPYLTDAKVEKVSNGKWTETTEVTEGDSVRVSLGYKLPAGTLDSTTEAGRTIHYQLPDGIKPSSATSRRVTNSSNVEVGSYTIDTNGLITIVFDQDKVAAESGAVSGTVMFQGTVSQLSSGNSGTISFGNSSSTITIKKKTETETHDLSISKTAEFADSTHTKAKYTVTASTNKGTGATVNITDKLSASNAKPAIDQSTLKVKKVDASGNETTVSDPKPKVGPDGNFSIEGLPALKAGEKYVVSYEVNINPGSGTSNGSIGNTAEGTSGNQSRTDTKWLSWGTSTSKSGWYDADNNQIVWNITVNPNGTDITGQKVTDTLPSGTKLTGPYTIKGADGTVLAQGGQAGDAAINYTFPSADANGKTLTAAQKTQAYTITCRTTAPSDNGQVANTATTTDNSGGTSGGNGTVYVQHRTLDVKKEHRSDSVDGKNRIATWTSTVTLPDTKLTDFTYTDTINNATDGNGTDLGADSHYALAGELEQYLAQGQHLAINLADGLTYVYRGYRSTKAHQIKNGQETETDDVTITVHYYDKDDKDGNEIVPSDANYNTKIKKFTVEIKVGNGVEVVAKSMVIGEYKTHIATSAGQEGQTWNISNTGAVADKTSTATDSYTVPKTVDKEVRIKDGKGDGCFAGGSVTKKLDSIADEQLEYRVILNTDSTTGSTITVTDTLPQGMSIVNGQVWARFFMNEYDEHQSNYKGTAFVDGANSTSGANPTYTATVNADGTTTITFTIGNYTYASGYPLVAIHYKTSVAGDSYWSDLKNDRKSYANTVEWNGHTDKQTTTVTRDVENVMKTGEQVVSNGSPTDIMRYYVDINPAAKDLDASSDTLTLTDTFGNISTYSPELLVDSIHLYAYKPNAENHKGDELDSSRYSATYDASKGVMTVKLPDGLACVLEYEERIDSSAVVAGNTVINSVNLSGQWSSQESTTLKDVTSSATANRRHVTLYKVDSDNYRTLLPGATFRLERWDSASSSWMTVSTSETTGADKSKDDYGMLSWDLNASNPKVTTDVLYRVIEAAAPDGYRLDGTPHCFVVRGSNETADNAWAKVGSGHGVQKSDVAFINYSGGALYIPNTYSRLTASKKWANSDGTSADAPKNTQVKLQLYQSTQTNDPDDTCTVTITARADKESDRGWAPDRTIAKKVKRGTAFKMKISDWNIAFTVAIGDGSPIAYSNSGVGYTEVSVPSAATNGATLSVLVKEPGNAVNDSNIAVSESTKPDDILTGKKAYGDAVTLDSTGWFHDWDGLPTTDSDGHALFYTVEEVSGPTGYTTTYTNNEGIQTGNITVTNTEQGYKLPETGGEGISGIIAVGAAIAAGAAAALGWRKKKRQA